MKKEKEVTLNVSDFWIFRKYPRILALGSVLRISELRNFNYILYDHHKVYNFSLLDQAAKEYGKYFTIAKEAEGNKRKIR